MCDAWCEVKQETWMCDQVTSPTLHLTSNIWRSDSFRDSSNNSSAITTSRFQLQKRIMEFTANIWSLVDRRSMSLNRWEDAETETGPLVGSVVFSTVVDGCKSLWSSNFNLDASSFFWWAPSFRWNVINQRENNKAQPWSRNFGCEQQQEVGKQ